MIRRMMSILLAAVLALSLAAGALGEENRIWQRGDTGDTVTRIQEKLRELKYLDREPTGVYDEETEQAILWFQRDHGLLETGMADAVTLRMLEETKEQAIPQETGEYEEVEDGYAMVDAAYGTYAPGMAVNGYAAAPAMGYRTMVKMSQETAFSTDEYTFFESNRFLSARLNPLSTFAADVDTASYAQFRRRVLSGETVPADSVRVEEMLNYFRYDYQSPKAGEPFGVTMELAPCPWNGKTMLLQIGLQAAVVPAEERPAHNLVFLIDTSGSMDGEDRLDLVRRAFLLLLEELRPEDTVSIVAYASQDRVVLEGVPASEKTRIMEAISELEAYGATNGTAGLLRAYEVAEKYRTEGGVNRILMATDGDLNVGVTSEGELSRLVMEKKKAGISLTCLGFGMGNYKDNKMEALADYGDGNCRYIDTIYEARKALVEEAGGTFITVAKDVKLQVDFNPVYVRGYRLIGYEDRLMAAEDFANDEKDGGEIGSGHRMTVLYEIVPVGSDFDFGEVASRYQEGGDTVSDGEPNGEWLTLSIRAKEPEGEESVLYEYPLTGDALRDSLSDNTRFAAAVAEVCMLLRDSEWKGSATYASALELLRGCGAVSGDPYKEEFLYLVTLLERAEKP